MNSVAKCSGAGPSIFKQKNRDERMIFESVILCKATEDGYENCS